MSNTGEEKTTILSIADRAKDLLRKTREWFTSQDRWQRNYLFDFNGLKTNLPWGQYCPDKCCVLGGLSHNYRQHYEKNEYVYNLARNALDDALGFLGYYGGITSYNDHKTYDEVMAVLEKAVDLVDGSKYREVHTVSK